MKGRSLGISLLFLFTMQLAYAEGEEAQMIDRGISAQNEQTLEMKEIDTQDLLLQNQNLESSSVEITGEALKEQQQQVKVLQNDSLRIEEELAEGVKPKGFWQKIKDFFTGE